MTHEYDVTRTFRHTYAAAFAIRIIELEAITHSFQYAFRAVGTASIALVTNAAGQTTSGLVGLFETYMNFVERRATLRHFE